VIGNDRISDENIAKQVLKVARMFLERNWDCHFLFKEKRLLVQVVKGALEKKTLLFNIWSYEIACNT